ncbi:histidine kinase N-terminal 7TM domain-containing protein [Haloarchaeobius salinus]|uniref:histidine kinase N-terminal 7TM domain-containing protein n=1 Tax=Haloarchaeobius salinus TaxID=1198298 RepID=UPI0021089626|nr:histidine kinase N-terminal 7TM domain-containing protein [Haloarchaeobius salinus]
MVTVAAVAVTAVLVLSATITAALAVFAYRNRDVPGAPPFAALMVLLANWTLTYAVGINLADPFWRLVVLRVQWVSNALLSVTLLLFVLAYTGRDGFVSRRSVALICAFPALVLVAVWTNHWHHLVWSEQAITFVDGMVILVPSYEPLFWAYLVYVYGLEAITIALVLQLVYRSEHLYADQSILLLVGITTPLLANVVEVFLLDGAVAVDYTPITFAISGLAFGYALFRRQLFDLVPATRLLGRRTAVGQLDAGIVIVDTDRRIVYCNEAAGEVFDVAPAEVLGHPMRTVVDEDAIDFDADDALAEITREDRTYEIRVSEVTDRHGTLLGHTLVVHDVTARKRRERELASQRDELARVNDLNAVIRGVNQALVSARTREDVEHAVCDRIVESDRYRQAAIADAGTWRGESDRWTVASDGGLPETVPPDIDRPGIWDDTATSDDAETDDPPVPELGDGDDGVWVIVPLVHGHTVYGALGLYTDRNSVGERERTILGELGRTIGHAINAVETNQLLAADTVVALELASETDDDPLVAATADGDVAFELAAIVPGGSGATAYLRTRDCDAETATAALADTGTGEARVVRSGVEGLVEWRVTGDALLGSVVDHGASIRHAEAADGVARYELDIASHDSVRTLVEHLEARFPEACVRSKSERESALESARGLSEEQLSELTDRQREVLEVAYRAGYFEWPRDSNAEEIAETLDISSATLHAHLRKAEERVLSELFQEP